MPEFLESLTASERRELLDYLHECRHDCLVRKQDSLFRNLSRLLRALERLQRHESPEL